MSHILLIDDNADDRELVEDLILSGSGKYTVHSVATSPDALAYLESTNVDCILLDYRLETESGIDVLLEIKETRPFMPVIMLTGQGDEDVATESMKNGSADYLIKQHLDEHTLRRSLYSAITSFKLKEKYFEQENQRRIFLQTLVHDIRSPLRHIQSFGEMLLEENDPEETIELLHRQFDAAKRATALVNSLESYALLDGEVPFETVSLNEIAIDAQHNLTEVINESNATILVHNLPDVYGNTSQLTQLLQKLMHNGLKYCDSETPAITVECEAETAENITIVVRDNGIGIPTAHLKTIFEPLKRLWGSEQYKGTGLGLAICQKIVERHKGLIWCSSTEGEGSTFHIRLPT